MSKGIALMVVFMFMASFIIMVKPVSSASSLQNSWVERSTPIPSQHWPDEAVVANRTIYLMGVFLRSEGYPSHLQDIISNNYAYNPSTDTWTAIAPMPTPRINFAIASYNNKIYVIGGLEVTASNTSQISCSVNEVYNLLTDTWATAASAPIGTAGAQANTVNGKIYVIGGSAGDVDLNYPKLNITQIFDPTTDSWTMGASMPHQVASAASAVMDNNIYVIGGDHTDFTQIYDTAKNAWSLGSATPALIPRVLTGGAGATTGVNASKRVYVFGGEEGFMFWGNQTYAYDPASNSWMTEEPMPDALMFPTVAVVNDVFYVFGVGSNWPGGVVAEQYTPVGYGTPDQSYALEHSAANITLLSPLNQTYNDFTIPLVFTVNKPLTWASYSLDGGQNITITSNSTISNVTNGLHSITMYANDTFGNIGASETVNFTIAKQEPTPFPVTVIASISATFLLLIGVGVVIYIKKYKR